MSKHIFEYVKDYENFDRKTEVVDLLCRCSDAFNPPLSVWREGHSLRDRMEVYILPSDSLLLVKINDYIVGLSHLKVAKGTERKLKVETTMIDALFRGKGLGSLLYEEIESLNRDVIKAPIIVRSTWYGNDVQLHLYRKFGYGLVDATTYPHQPSLKRYTFEKSVTLF